MYDMYVQLTVSGRVNMLTSPVAAARAAVATVHVG